MPPLDFPNSPATGATYTGPNGVIWQYDGAKWISGTSANVYAAIASPVFLGDPQAPNPAAGDADTSIATTAFVAAAVATSLHDVGRNYIHNSMFNIQQRGNGPFTANAVWSLDRWKQILSLDTVSVIPGGLSDADRTQIGDEAAIYALSNTFTGNAGTGAYNFITQGIESVRRLAGKTVTVSFWAKAGSGTLKLGVNIQQIFGTGGSPSAAGWALTTGIASTLNTTWARYTATIAVPSAAGKTTGTNNDSSTVLAFWFSCGTDNNAVAGNIGVQSGTIIIWGVQLELGPTATPLEKLDPVTDLQRCQRFYQTGFIQLAGNAAAGAGNNCTIPFPVTMRGMPAVTPTFTNQTNCSGSTIYVISPGFYQPYTIGTAAGGYTVIGTFTASADL